MAEWNGFLGISRDLFESPAWLSADACQRDVLITLLQIVSWKERDFRVCGEIIHVGPRQVVISLHRLLEKCGEGATEHKIRNALKFFEKLSIVSRDTTHGVMLITVAEWVLPGIGDCQFNEEGVKGASKERQADGTGASSGRQAKEPYNQVTKEPREREHAPAPAARIHGKAKPEEAAEVAAYFNERAYDFDHKAEAETFFDFYESKGWRVGSVPMNDWRAAARNWAKRKAAAPGGPRGSPASWRGGGDAPAGARHRERRCGRRGVSQTEEIIAAFERKNAEAAKNVDGDTESYRSFDFFF